MAAPCNPHPKAGLVLALKITPADEQERAQVGDLVRDIQQTTRYKVEVAVVDQGYTGEHRAGAFGLIQMPNGRTTLFFCRMR